MCVDLKTAIIRSMDKCRKIIKMIEDTLDQVIEDCAICGYYGDCDACIFKSDCERSMVVRFLCLAEDEVYYILKSLERRLNEQ